MTQNKPSIEQVKDLHTANLMSIQGVEGVGIGEEQGRQVIKVFVSDASSELRQRIPAELEGYPVSIEQSGQFHAFNTPPLS